jgi:hypothetical protein
MSRREILQGVSKDCVFQVDDNKKELFIIAPSGTFIIGTEIDHYAGAFPEPVLTVVESIYGPVIQEVERRKIV